MNGSSFPWVPVFQHQETTGVGAVQLSTKNGTPPAQYLRAHFEKPWKRNAVSYSRYWLEGPNPAETWNRDSCYGDVFVVQDAGSFYLAVYLLGQLQAKFRGMPSSIPFGGNAKDPNYNDLPDKYSVRLLTRSGIWRSLDDVIGLLELPSGRRRGKASGEVKGNFGNDYQMLGLFDPDGNVVNPQGALPESEYPLFSVNFQEKQPKQGDSVPKHLSVASVMPSRP